MILETENSIKKIDEEIATVPLENQTAAQRLRVMQLKRNRQELLEQLHNNLTPQDKVFLARHAERPNITAYIEALFDDFFPLSGDRNSADDQSILGGLAFYKGIPVTVIGHRKGKNLAENVACNFGMPNPEGYRKALRLMRQAEKFRRPVITFVDTPGAYPGIEAEARGQGEAIAQCLATMSDLKVPVISVVIGEGGSGGALAIAVADRLFMLENAVFSILSPEGFASILWKDSKRSPEACTLMKLTAQHLLEFKIADQIIPEPAGGAHRDPQAVFAQLDEVLSAELHRLMKSGVNALIQKRYQKLRRIGRISERRRNEGD